MKAPIAVVSEIISRCQGLTRFFHAAVSPCMGMMDEAIDDLRQQISIVYKNKSGRAEKSPVTSADQAFARTGSTKIRPGAPRGWRFSSSDGFLLKVPRHSFSTDGRRGFRPNFSNTGRVHGTVIGIPRSPVIAIQDATNRTTEIVAINPTLSHTYGYGGRPSYYGWSPSFGYRAASARPKLQRLVVVVSSLKELRLSIRK